MAPKKKSTAASKKPAAAKKAAAKKSAASKPTAASRRAAPPAKKPPTKNPPSKTPAKNIVVTVADDHLAEIQSVAKKLRSRGMHIDDVLAGIGVISGSADADAQLLSIPGVLGVEEQTQFHVPPPDAPVK